MRDGYNGWANRETWQVNLEMFDGFDPSDVWDTNAADREELTDSLAECLEAMTAEAVGIPESSHFAWGVMHNFLRRVDWQEIAAAMVEDYADKLPDHLRADADAGGVA